jgi:triosephosphate isomerase
MIRAMRPVIVAGNWKMNTTPADAGELAREIASRTREPGVVRILCPPFVCLAAVRDALASADLAALDGQGVAVGAQDVHHEPAGAYTGWISAPMLAGLATWVIVGHSERRRDAGETDEVIGRKLLAARAHGLRTILCVGEQLAEREAGRAIEVVDRQVRACLAGADPATLGMDGGLPWLTIAYEPVWAIGTGRTARGSDAAAMADAIRATLGELGFPDDGDAVPILYGGSVTSAAIGEFLAEPAIDGALVGGASLKPDEMAGIVARAALTASARAEAARA